MMKEEDMARWNGIAMAPALASATTVPMVPAWAGEGPDPAAAG
jgi:hypothetical protein